MGRPHERAEVHPLREALRTDGKISAHYMFRFLLRCRLLPENRQTLNRELIRNAYRCGA